MAAHIGEKRWGPALFSNTHWLIKRNGYTMINWPWLSMSEENPCPHRGAACFPDNEPLTRYAKLRVVHAPGMLGTFSPPRGLAIPTCITERESESRCMRNQQLYVSGNRLMCITIVTQLDLIDKPYLIKKKRILLINQLINWNWLMDW